MHQSIKTKTTRLIIVNRKNLLLIFCSLLLIVQSCSDRNNHTATESETYYGSYLARDLNLVESASKQDSVFFQVFNNATFEITFYENVNSTDDIDFCDCGGTILDFGTGNAEFGPTYFTYDNCDTSSVPRGRFGADFVNHGDTIWIFKQITNNSANPPYDSLYMLKLLK